MTLLHKVSRGMVRLLPTPNSKSQPSSAQISATPPPRKIPWGIGEFPQVDRDDKFLLDDRPDSAASSASHHSPSILAFWFVGH